MLGGVVRIVCMVILGVGLGFIVAAVSFPNEEARYWTTALAVILFAYALAGLGLGFRSSVWYGLGLALPGGGFLLVLMLGVDGTRWPLGYAALITATAAGGAYVGARLGRDRL